MLLPAHSPATRRTHARIRFIYSLARLTSALVELRAARVFDGSPLSEEEEQLEREVLAAHPFLNPAVRHSGMSLIHIAGTRRHSAAVNWAKRWNIEADWVVIWAVFALLAWDISRACQDADCSFGCAAVKAGDDSSALDWILENEERLSSLAERPLLISILLAMQEEQKNPTTALAAGDDLSRWYPIHKRPVVGPVLGPHPLLETKEEFLKRAHMAWDEAVDVIRKEGFDLSVPRKLDLHCGWLVRYQVAGETAAAIVADDDKTDTSTVYKAVRTLAQLIELPIRSTTT